MLLTQALSAWPSSLLLLLRAQQHITCTSPGRAPPLLLPTAHLTAAQSDCPRGVSPDRGSSRRPPLTPIQVEVTLLCSQRGPSHPGTP